MPRNIDKTTFLLSIWGNGPILQSEPPGRICIHYECCPSLKRFYVDASPTHTQINFYSRIVLVVPNFRFLVDCRIMGYNWMSIIVYKVEILTRWMHNGLKDGMQMHKLL